jgi:hypothetical protein
VSLRTLSDHVADICQNSVKAGARTVQLEIKETENVFFFKVMDDAGGMPQAVLKQIYDPFYTTRDKNIRRVGLGIPFLKSAAEQTGGEMDIVSQEGIGTMTTAKFFKSNIDCQPVGDIVGTLFTLITSDKNTFWNITRNYNEEEYVIDTKKLMDNLPDSSMWENPAYMNLLRESLCEMESSIKD